MQTHPPLAMAVPDLNAQLAQKEAQAKQERSFIYNMKIQKMQLANQYLSLSEVARKPNADAAAIAFIAAFLAEPCALGDDPDGFIR